MRYAIKSIALLILLLPLNVLADARVKTTVSERRMPSGTVVIEEQILIRNSDPNILRLGPEIERQKIVLYGDNLDLIENIQIFKGGVPLADVGVSMEPVRATSRTIYLNTPGRSIISGTGELEIFAFRNKERIPLPVSIHMLP